MPFPSSIYTCISTISLKILKKPKKLVTQISIDESLFNNALGIPTLYA